MEKYSQFRDKATGIAPFWPNNERTPFLSSTANDNGSTITNGIELIIKHSVLIIRAILILPLLLLSLIMSSTLGLTSIISQFLNKCTLYLIIGLTNVEYTIQDIKTRYIKKDLHYPKRGEAFFVNFSSPLDLLILSTCVNDDFVCLVPSGGGLLKKITLLEFIQLSLSGSDSISQDIGTKVSSDDFKDKVVFIFAEGTTSNGKSVLTFPFTNDEFNTFFNNILASHVKKLNSLSIRIVPRYLSTPLQTSVFSYGYKLLTNPSINYRIHCNKINDTTMSIDLQLDKIRNSFTKTGRLVTVALGLKEKKEFIEKFNSNSQNKNNKKK